MSARAVTLVVALTALAPWLELAAQEPSPTLGDVREVTVVPVARGDGQVVRLALSTTAPDGSVVSAALLEEQQPPPVAVGQGGARGGAVVVLLRLPERAAPGLYEALVSYDPTTQARWVIGRAPPSRRAVPVVVGTVAEAQAARDQAIAAASACADAAVDVAAVVVQGFGPRARRWSRAGLQDFLRELAVPRALALEQALQALRPTRPLAREEAPLRAIGRRALRDLAVRARAACLELEVPLPSLFTAERADPGAVEAAGGDVDDDDVEDLLVAALAARDLARRGGLAPEPSPLTLERLGRRAAWLAAAAKAPAGQVRRDALAYVLEDARQALGRVRPALATLGDGDVVARVQRPLTALDPALARPLADPADLLAAGDAARTLGEQVEALLGLVRRRHLADDRAALVDLHARLAEAAGAPAIAAAWRRALAVVERRLATAPTAARALAAALRAAGDEVAAGHPVAPDADARWQQALAGFDALLAAR